MSLSCVRTRLETKARRTMWLRQIPKRSHFCARSNAIWRPSSRGSETDPKVQVVLHYLRDRQWLETNGAIIFSQYLTTAQWVLEALCEAFPNESVALYAGGSASFVQRGQSRTKASRELIKALHSERRHPARLRDRCSMRRAKPPAARCAGEYRHALEPVAARTA